MDIKLTTVTPKPSKIPARQQKVKRERIYVLITLAVIAVAWVIGGVRAEADLLPAVEYAQQESGFFERVGNGLYEGYSDSSKAHLVGYVAIAQANGYGGPMTMAVAVSLDGTVEGVVVADHKETPSWMDRVMNASFLDQLIGKPYSDGFDVNGDLDVVTGATYTSKAMAEAALLGSREVAAYLGFADIEKTSPKIVFGVPEIVLIGLYAAGYLGQNRKFAYKKQLRWVTLITGMVVLGFIFNKPLTLSMVNQALLGYWPHWQNSLYWFLLIGGILFVFTVDNKNPYCEFFCPFGAAQECMGAIGGAKTVSLGKYRDTWIWVHRILTWVAILIALVFRNPGISSYEIFGTLFKLVGNNLQFILLGMVLIVSLFIKRPWCHYLCPLHPVEEFIRVIRRWIKELWQKSRTKQSV